MDILKKIYDKYITFQTSCKGQNINWIEKYNEVKDLYREANNIKFQYSKNAVFYSYVKEKLLQDIGTEMDKIRVIMKQ